MTSTSAASLTRSLPASTRAAPIMWGSRVDEAELDVALVQPPVEAVPSAEDLGDAQDGRG